LRSPEVRFRSTTNVPLASVGDRISNASLQVRVGVTTAITSTDGDR
jgi:hypothetical protein